MAERRGYTPEQIANANLGAVPEGSRVGRSMVEIRNSGSPATIYHHIYDTARTAIKDRTRKATDRLKQFAHDAGPAVGVAGALAAVTLVTGCGPDGGAGGIDGGGTDGGAGNAPADGSQIPNFGDKVAQCIEANTPPVQPGDVPQPAPADPPALFDDCQIAIINGADPTAPLP